MKISKIHNLGVAVATVALSAAGVVMSAPAAHAESRVIDYYQVCYDRNRAPSWYGVTIYAGAENRGSGVLCKAWVRPNRSALPLPSPWNNYYTWSQLCGMAGYKGLSWVDTRTGAMICWR